MPNGVVISEKSKMCMFRDANTKPIHEDRFIHS